MNDTYASNTKTAINDQTSYSSNRKTAINDQASKDTIALEVSAQDLLQWSGGTWLAVDMRDESSCAYGMMEGALRISEAELLDFVQKLPVNSMKESSGEAQPSPVGSSETISDHSSLPESSADREIGRENSVDISTVTSRAFARLEDALQSGLPLVLYCKYGRISRDAAEAFREKGWKNVCSLTGGYGRWALEESYRAAQDEQRRDHNGLRFIQCACKFTETCSSCADDGTSNSKRLETKKLIAALKETNPQVESNIFRATENVVLNKVLGYKLHGEKHSFLEDY